MTLTKSIEFLYGQIEKKFWRKMDCCENLTQNDCFLLFGILLFLSFVILPIDGRWCIDTAEISAQNNGFFLLFFISMLLNYVSYYIKL